MRSFESNQSLSTRDYDSEAADEIFMSPVAVMMIQTISPYNSIDRFYRHLPNKCCTL
ncbi:hypothetical protein EPK97_02345 [Chengkuizengella sediminis]|nr:hypothetical protein [Chengkuizengella sediminis]